MRFSVCLRLTRSAGFFWGTLFVPYGAFLAGWLGSQGYRGFWRGLVFCLAEGLFVGPLQRAQSKPQARVRSLGHTLLFFAPGHIPVAYPWAWFILRQLKLRTYRGLRYRLGLPSRGQRTHTNAQTTTKHADPASIILRRLYWRKRLWQVRVVSKATKSKQSRGGAKKQKVTKKKGSVVRSKDKKKSVWR